MSFDVGAIFGATSTNSWPRFFADRALEGCEPNRAYSQNGRYGDSYEPGGGVGSNPAWRAITFNVVNFLRAALPFVASVLGSQEPALSWICVRAPPIVGLARMVSQVRMSGFEMESCLSVGGGSSVSVDLA